VVNPNNWPDRAQVTQAVCYIEGALSPPAEVLINEALATLSAPVVPPEVRDFAAEKGVHRYLGAVIELARQAFPASALSVSLGQDAEDETHQYIALDIEAGGRTTDELLAGQRAWSGGIGRVCPSRQAVYFVLGWR
jgi:hypothetical protein